MAFTGGDGKKKKKLTFAKLTFILQDKSNIIAVRTAVLAGLVLHLKEDSSEVFKTCEVIYNILDKYTGRTTNANIDCANVEMI